MNELYKEQLDVLVKQNAQLSEQIARLKDALENLMGEQNGPPLIRDAHHWKNAMDKAEQALAAHPLEERQGE